MSVPSRPVSGYPACRLPTWTREELGKRTSMGCPLGPFFGRVGYPLGPFFRRVPACGCRPPLAGRTAVTQQVAPTFTASVIVDLAAHHAARPDRARSPKRVFAHDWEGLLVR